MSSIKSPFCTFSCINPGFGDDLADPDPRTCYEYFLKWHFLNASKEYFWQKKNLNFIHGFKSAILAKMKNCQNGTFEPVHEIQKFFWPKYSFEAL